MYIKTAGDSGKIEFARQCIYIAIINVCVCKGIFPLHVLIFSET